MSIPGPISQAWWGSENTKIRLTFLTNWNQCNITFSASPCIADASELSPVSFPGNSHMGPDNLPIQETETVKNLLVLLSWPWAEAFPSGGSRTVSRRYHSLPPTFWERQGYWGLGGLQWAAASWRGLLPSCYWPPLPLCKKGKDTVLKEEFLVWSQARYLRVFFWQGPARKAIAKERTFSFSYKSYFHPWWCYSVVGNLCLWRSVQVLA